MNKIEIIDHLKRQDVINTRLLGICETQAEQIEKLQVSLAILTQIVTSIDKSTSGSQLVG